MAEMKLRQRNLDLQLQLRREEVIFFYDKYLLDPEVSEKTVLKKDKQERVVTEDNIDDWFTAEQVAKFKGIEPGVDQYKELVAASVKGLPERKHEDENLAALGVAQYHYQATKTKNQTLKRKLLELQAEGEVDVEVNWVQVYKDNQKKCKSSLGSMATELHNCDTLLGKIAALPNSSQMKPLLSKQVQAQKKLMEDEKKKFLSETWPFPRLALMRLQLKKRTRL
ncbi:unnamed protein product [Effrenium voratum]|nr:unnamed protein product [Effrenium voratum]